MYSFEDREEIYQMPDSQQLFIHKPLKCGFLVQSVLDQVRLRYSHNQTCQTVVFTSITNCYDPLPDIRGTIHPSFCFVALIDTRTKNAYQKSQSPIPWDLIDLGVSAAPFSVEAKSAETLKILGERMFPMAKWIVWLDEKAGLVDVTDMLAQARVPVMGARHPDAERTSASEVEPSKGRLSSRY